VYQKNIDLAFVRQLKNKLGPAPSDEEIFRTCLPYDHPQPPVTWSRVHHNKFVFMSPSNDLRFLGTMRLQASNIKDYAPPGNLVVGVCTRSQSNSRSTTSLSQQSDRHSNPRASFGAPARRPLLS